MLMSVLKTLLKFMGLCCLALMIDSAIKYSNSISFDPANPGPQNLVLKFENGPYRQGGPIEDNLGRKYLRWDSYVSRIDGQEKTYYYCSRRRPLFCTAKIHLDSRNRVFNHDFLHNHP